MMPENTILEFYQSEFKRINVKPQRGGVALQHAAWMVEECLIFGNPKDFLLVDLAKVNRWIGFIQGVLWKEGIYTIDQLRQHVVNAKEVTNARAMVSNYWSGPDATV